MNKTPTGTKEWAKHSANLQLGCEHNCLYCYARAIAVQYARIDDEKRWTDITYYAKEGNLKKYGKKVEGTIMFPTAHDITPANLGRCINFLGYALRADNKVLIVSKPHYDCIMAICAELQEHKDQILFRFTIGSADNRVLKFWEPNAPDYAERKQCLIWAFEKGFETSVSVEPMLDENMTLLYYDLKPFITNSIWFGKMNKISERVKTVEWQPKDYDYLKKVIAISKRGSIWPLYNTLKDQPLVKWKDSIKKIIGLPTPKEIGLDE